MSKILGQGPIEMSHPDWFFATDDELRAHANNLVAVFASMLDKYDNCEERPAGEVVSSIITLPIPDESNITTQARYLGYCAEACRSARLVIRDIGLSEDDGNNPYLSFAVSTVEGMDRAQAEADAEDHPDRSFRTH